MGAQVSEGKGGGVTMPLPAARPAMAAPAIANPATANPATVAGGPYLLGRDVRLAACNALAAVSVAQEGRDAVRSAGGLRPLVLLLAEGSRSATAAAAASAIMNCSACDVCKEAIADCRGVPLLLALIKEAVLRCNVSNPPASTSSTSTIPAPPPSTSSPARPAGGKAASSSGGTAAATAAANAAAGQDLRSPGECKAAVYAAGALMNMGGVISVQEKMLAAGAVPILEATVRIALPGDVVATRANFMMSWLAVATGGLQQEAARESRRGTGTSGAGAGSVPALHHQLSSLSQAASTTTASPRGTSRQVSLTHSAASAPLSARSTSSGAATPAPSGGPGTPAGGSHPHPHPHPLAQHPQQQQQGSSRLGSPATATGGGRVMAGSAAVGLRSVPGTPDHKPGSAGKAAAPLTGRA